MRDAIDQANANPGGDTITFSVTGTITLASPLPPSIGPLVVQGSPGVIIDGIGLYRAFMFLAGDGALRDLVIRNARAKGGDGGIGQGSSGGGGMGAGGGLFVNSGVNVIVSGVAFQDNVALGGNAGAIAAESAGAAGPGGGGMGGNGGNSRYTGGGGGGGLIGQGGSSTTAEQGNPGFVNGGAAGGLGGNTYSSGSGGGGPGGGGGGGYSGGAGGASLGFPGTSGTGGCGDVAGSPGSAGAGGAGGNGSTDPAAPPFDYQTGGGGGGAPGGGGGGGSDNACGGGGGDFGGGGGAGLDQNLRTTTGAPGGFGGGGAGGASERAGGAGGFGGGNGGTGGDYGTGLGGSRGNGGSAYGGAIFVRQGGTVTFAEGSMSGNIALAGTGNANGSADGRGIYLHGSSTLSLNTVVSSTLSDPIAGTGSVSKTSPGTVTLAAANTYTGGTTVGGGTLVVNGSIPSATVSGGTLAGTGTVPSVVATSGAINPGVGGSGLLNVGTMSLAGGVTYFATIGPTTARARIAGNITLGGATLSVTLAPGYTHTVGAAHTIVENAGVQAIGGVFAGLAPNALTTIGGNLFRISYASGAGGRQVTLTAVGLPSAPTGVGGSAGNANATISYGVPLSNGGLTITGYTVICNPGAITVTVSTLSRNFTGLVNGTPYTCTVAAVNAAGTGPASAPVTVTPTLLNVTGPDPDGVGVVTAALAGGGGGCSFAPTPAFVPPVGDPRSPPELPPMVAFPHGLFDFSLVGCTPGATVTLTLAYPDGLPVSKAQFFKYGPTVSDPVPHWSPFPATLAGNTLVITLVDGGAGDSDLAANGAIANLGGLGVRVPDPPVFTPATVAYQGTWWASPGGRENGWGINTTHQGNTIFATWFTYDANGDGQWLVMSNAERAADGSFTGKIHRVTGPAFDAVPFDPRLVTRTEVGTGTLTFTSATEGTFAYTLDGVTQSKPITRQVFGDVVPECVSSGSTGTIDNYQDLWWNAGGSESGWGLNITHQGEVIFATWFTFAASGKGQWLVMSNLRRVERSDTYTGKIYRSRANRFDAQPWDSSSLHLVEVGEATLSFPDRSNGTFAYTLDGITQQKAITRTVFKDASAVCRYP
ncbi:hypothetical protein DSM104443_02453 [Usitatibacter rugosus]|uniref:Fibronectin type-III domain-containing protein n=1 Tax=Usitatibacter rugosus TaxID=2732067 RepID=A0A6M4GWY1_9PROT|nr:hypothetical protein DSM104443_02453 [Usitatibacter rugosus]